MQVYKELKILTARPFKKDYQNIKHYLYGFQNAKKNFSTGDWLKLANQKILQCQKIKKTPILVGGTGLYFKALTDGLVNIPKIPTNFRDKIRNLHKKIGQKKFFQKLLKIDPLIETRINSLDAQTRRQFVERCAATSLGLSILPTAQLMAAGPAKQNSKAFTWEKVGGIHAQWAQGGGLSCLWPEGAATSVVQLNQSSGHLVEQSANDDEGSQNPATAFPLRRAPLYLFITGCSAACALPRHALLPLPPPPPPALRAPRPPPRPRSSDVGGWDPPPSEPCPGCPGGAVLHKTWTGAPSPARTRTSCTT